MLENVTSQIKEGDEIVDKCVVKIDIDETTEAAVSRYGEDVVYSRYRGALVIDIQSFVRSKIRHKDGRWTDEQIQSAIDDWRPGVKATPRSPVERVEDLLDKLTDDDREAILAKIRNAS